MNCDEKAVRGELLAEMLGAPLKSLKLTQERLDWLVKSIQANEASSTKERSGQLKSLQNDQRDLETKQSLIYEDKLDGTITKEFWKRKNEEYSVRLNWIKGEIEKFSQENGSGLANVERLLELSQNAYSLYLKQKPHEQRKLLDLLQSNFTMKDQKVHAELRHPYDLIVDGALEDQEKIKRGESIFAQNENWLLG